MTDTETTPPAVKAARKRAAKVDAPAPAVVEPETPMTPEEVERVEATAAAADPNAPDPATEGAGTAESTPAPEPDPVPGAVKASRKRAVKAPVEAPTVVDVPTAPVEAKAPDGDVPPVLETGATAYLDGDESVEWTLAKRHSANLVAITRETSPGHYLGDYVSPARLTLLA